MTLEELQIVFSQKGGEGVLAQISKISTAIDAFIKKHSKGSADVLKNYQKVLQEIEKKQAVSFGNISKKAAESNRNVLSFYDAEIKKLDELRKAREEAYGSASGGTGEGGGSITGGRGGGGLKTKLMAAFLPLYLFRFIDQINTKEEADRQKTFIRQNQEMLSGTKSTAAAVGYDIGLSRYGGIRGEGLESLRSFSAQLGMATRGDVSFLQTLGRWGISGVSPYDDPMSVAKKIAARARELSPNEQNALFESVEFTNAQASAALKGDFSIFEKTGELTKVSDKVRDFSENFAETVQTLVANLDTVNQKIGENIDWYNELLKDYPNLANWIKKITGYLPDFFAALGGIAAFKTVSGLSSAAGAAGAAGGGAAGAAGAAGGRAVGASVAKTAGLATALLFTPNTASSSLELNWEHQHWRPLPEIDRDATDPRYFEKERLIKDKEQELRGLYIFLAKGKASQKAVDDLRAEIDELKNLKAVWTNIDPPSNEARPVNIGPVNITVDSENAAEEISTQLIELANAQ